jgi:uncharacterized protein YbjT (DUF2867 family)
VILVAGGTGTLGTHVVRALTAQRTQVRVLTRRAERASHLAGTGAEIVVGDVRDPAAVEKALAGTSAVVSAVQGFAGTEPAGPRAVDLGGNANLIRAARAAGTRQFVLISAAGAAPDSPLDLRRVKYQAEQAVIGSGLHWTILRPTVYLETWISLLGDMLATKGAVTLFGRGTNPINFVSAYDVAALVARVTATEFAAAAEFTSATLEIGGPEDLTLADLAGRVLAERGAGGPIRHVPLPVLRAMATLLRPVKPMIATLARFGVIMDTTDMTLPRDTARAAVPGLPATTLADLQAGAAATDLHRT